MMQLLFDRICDTEIQEKVCIFEREYDIKRINEFYLKKAYADVTSTSDVTRKIRGEGGGP